MAVASTPSRDIEPRWPVVVTILIVGLLLVVLPGRVKVFPPWVIHLAVFTVLVPMAALWLSGAKRRWLRVERVTTALFFLAAAIGCLGGLVYLIHGMVTQTEELSGLELLTSSVAVWTVNVLMFSLLYWQTDRGGPGARIDDRRPRPDWIFPQEEAPPEAVAPGWRPVFVDYLFLSFSTATAFSPTDVLPLTPRAKMMMMAESAIALATIVMVAARAINLLG